MILLCAMELWSFTICEFVIGNCHLEFEILEIETSYKYWEQLFMLKLWHFSSTCHSCYLITSTFGSGITYTWCSDYSECSWRCSNFTLQRKLKAVFFLQPMLLHFIEQQLQRVGIWVIDLTRNNHDSMCIAFRYSQTKLSGSMLEHWSYYILRTSTDILACQYANRQAPLTCRYQDIDILLYLHINNCHPLLLLTFTISEEK